MSCPKYFLFSINLLVWIASVVVLGLALFVYMDVKEAVNLLSSAGVNLHTIPISVIAAGCVIFVVSFSGCCGAMKEWKWMLCMYLVFLLIIIGAEAYLIYVVLKFRDVLPQKVGEWINYAFRNHMESFSILETSFKCCGSTGTDSYNKLSLPVSPNCCKFPQDNTCLKDTYKGCGEVFIGYVEKYSKYGGYGMIGVGVVELLAVVAALYMICTMTKKHYRI